MSIRLKIGAKFPGWIRLSTIANSKTIRSSYFWIVVVPILAKFLQKVPESVSFFGIELTASLPFSWKLLYFSACAFGVATLLYSYRCPNLIKNHKDWTEFKSSGMAQEQLKIYLHNFLRSGGEILTVKGDLKDHYWILKSVLEKFCGGEYKLDESKEPHFSALNLPIDSGVASDAYWYLRSMMNYHSSLIRVLITILYAIGFLLVAVVLVENFMFVFRE